MPEEGAPSNRQFKGKVNDSIVRSYEDEMKYLKRLTPWKYEISEGFVPNMKVNGAFYVNDALEELVFDELKNHCTAGGNFDLKRIIKCTIFYPVLSSKFLIMTGFGGFLPAVKQIANVAALPGIVGASIGLPDVHSGYGFAIGNVAAFDMDNPESIVSPGGVGFDINCGVRLLRTNLTEADITPVKEQLAQSLFDHIPVGVGSKGVIPTSSADLDSALEMGIDWSIREGYAWAEGSFSQ